MSRDLYIDAVLDKKPGFDSVTQLVLRGEWLGFGYLRTDTFPRVESYLKPDEVLSQLMIGLAYAHVNPQDLSMIAHLMLKALETYISVILYDQNGYLALSLRPAGTCWVAEGERPDSDELDLERYMELLIDWCRDFTLLRIEVIDSYNEK